MRLTLRTLLAWIDGVLPAEEQRQLGERVAGSTVATHLTERIRAAIGRTAIGVPRVDAKGLADDMNSVAEYLDNVLPSERLEPFERICIESELHLAEVAACHGLLAEVARRSGASADALSEEERHHLQDRVQRRLDWDRERLAADHGASPHSAADHDDAHRESRDTARAIRAAMGEGAPGNVTPAGAAGRGGAVREDVAVDPARVEGGVAIRPTRRSSLVSWLSAMVALGLVVALAGTLAWSLTRSRGRGIAPVTVAAAVPPAAATLPPAADSQVPQEPRVDASRTDPTGGQPAGPEQAITVPASDEHVQTVEPPPVVAAMAAPQVGPPVVASALQPGPQPSPRPVTQPSPADAADPAPLAAAPNATPVAVPSVAPPPTAVPPTAMATVSPTPAPATPGTGPTPDGAVAAVMPSPAPTTAPGAALASLPSAATPAAGSTDVDVGFVGGEGVLLHRDAAATADAWRFLPPNSRLGPREELLVPPGFHPELNVRGVTIRLLPATRAVLTLDADGTPRIEVVFGRAVARSALPDVRLGVTAGGLVGRVEAGLTEPVAVEVDLRRFPGTQPVETPLRSRADIVAASRGIAWRQTGRDGGPATAPLEGIDAQGMLPAGAALTWDSVAPTRAAVVHEPMPAWVEASPRPDRLEKSACEALAAKVTETVPLTRALRELASDRRAENRMLAAATLALVGEYDELVEMLCDDAPGRRLEPRQWAQLEAATVPLALARGGEAAAALRRSFAAHGPNGKTDALWTMACGINDAQIVAGDDRLLVEKLEDPSLVVRRYASKCLVDIVQPSAADRLRYRPDAPPDLRRDGVLWWRQQAERGLIRRPDSVEAGGRARDAGGRGSAAN